MHNSELSEQEKIRRNSLEEIRKLGYNPYPPETFEFSHKSAEVKSVFEKDESALTDISLAGRTPVKGFFDCLVYLLGGDKDCDTDLYGTTGVGHQGAGNGINIIRCFCNEKKIIATKSKIVCFHLPA